MSSVAENNSEVAVEKVVSATEEIEKPVKGEDTPAAAADNGTKTIKEAKGVKRPAVEVSISFENCARKDLQRST